MSRTCRSSCTASAGYLVSTPATELRRCPEIRSVCISPYLLKEYNNRWYLIASASDTKRLLTFPLDRIDDFIFKSDESYLSSPENLYERYEEIIGVTYNEDSLLQKIIFWVSENSKNYIITKPIHGSQKTLRGEMDSQLRSIYSNLKDGQFFQIECRENYELIRELCSFGQDLIVISPSTIKETIVYRIAQQCEFYKRLGRT